MQSSDAEVPQEYAPKLRNHRLRLLLTVPAVVALSVAAGFCGGAIYVHGQFAQLKGQLLESVGGQVESGTISKAEFAELKSQILHAEMLNADYLSVQTLNLKNSKKELVGWIEALETGAEMHMAVPKGKASVRLTFEDGLPSISLSDEHGNLRAVLGTATTEVIKTGETHISPVSRLTLFGKDGRVNWHTP